MFEETGARQFITAAFGAWQRAGIPFVVLRNYESLPQSTTNDIDVLIGPGQQRQAEQVLIQTAGECGYRLHLRAEYATLALYFSTAKSHSQIHFDLFSGFTWRGIPYLDSEPFLQSKVQRDIFFVPHPAHESACNLLSSLVYTGKLKSKYQGGISAAFATHPETARNLLGKTYGTRLAARIVETAIAGRWSEIESLAGPVRATAVRRQLASRPLCTLAAGGVRCQAGGASILLSARQSLRALRTRWLRQEHRRTRSCGGTRWHVQPGQRRAVSLETAGLLSSATSHARAGNGSSLPATAKRAPLSPLL